MNNDSPCSGKTWIKTTSVNFIIRDTHHYYKPSKNSKFFTQVAQSKYPLSLETWSQLNIQVNACVRNILCNNCLVTKLHAWLVSNDRWGTSPTRNGHIWYYHTQHHFYLCPTLWMFKSLFTSKYVHMACYLPFLSKTKFLGFIVFHVNNNPMNKFVWFKYINIYTFF